MGRKRTAISNRRQSEVTELHKYTSAGMAKASGSSLHAILYSYNIYTIYKV